MRMSSTRTISVVLVILPVVILLVTTPAAVRGQAFADLEQGRVDYSRSDLEPARSCDTLTRSLSDEVVEAGQAPDSMIASKVVGGEVVRTRPLCPYPQWYNGNGSIDDAASFSCVAP